MNPSVGSDFHKGTKYLRGKLPSHRLDWSVKPPTFKKYSESKRLELPEPDTHNGPYLWDILRTRRSVRAYAPIEVTLEQLSQMLWATQGITAMAGEHYLRTAPSAGALYPIETYLGINRVTEVDSGLYHYSVLTNELELLRVGDFSKDLASGALDQGIASRASVVFIWSAVFQRSKWKYLERSYRYIFLDAGHIAQNLALAAQGLGLASCQIVALYDDEMNSLLGLDGEKESVIYMSSVGIPKRQGLPQ